MTKSNPVEETSAETSTNTDPMDTVELKALVYIEQVWNFHEKWPSKEKMQERFPDFSVDRSLRKIAFINALANRGIGLPQIESDLSAEQLAAVNTVLNFADRRSRAAKLHELGISPTKWGGWMKNPVFKEYLHTVSAANFSDNIHVAHEGILKAIDKGSVDAAKFYLEVTGRYQGSNAEIQNLKLVLARVMEAIQRNVKDPELLQKIAHDFDIIMRGEQLAEPVAVQMIDGI